MSKLLNKNILITCGPTWVAIDDVRVISNISTGELGQTIARKGHERGAKVTLLEGPVEQRMSDGPIKVRPYKYYNELTSILKEELTKTDTHYDVVFHAAAVSDYAIKDPFETKMKSDEPFIRLELIPLPKLIRSIRNLSPKTTIVGFKLESDMDEKIAVEATKTLFTDDLCDLVVANTLKEQNYLGLVVEKDKILASDNRRADLAEKLLDIIEGKL